MTKRLSQNRMTPRDADDPREEKWRARLRRRVFSLLIGTAMIAAVAVAFYAPQTALEDNAASWPWVLPPVLAAMFVAALGWLAIHVMSSSDRDDF